MKRLILGGFAIVVLLTGAHAQTQHEWLSFEADNGYVLRVDMASVQKNAVGLPYYVVVVDIGHGDLRQWHVSCRESTISELGGGGIIEVYPRSIGGKALHAVCSKGAALKISRTTICAGGTSRDGMSCDEKYRDVNADTIPSYCSAPRPDSFRGLPMRQIDQILICDVWRNNAKSRQ